MDTKQDKNLRRLTCLALVLATFITYWKVAGNNYINFDDDEYVIHNPWVNHGLTLASVIWAFTHFYAQNWHPLTWISHMLDCQLFGLQPGPQHVVNLLFHCANVVLLFGLLNRLTKALWRSAMVAGLFALHPLHVESVAWIAERKDVLSTFFGLLTLRAYARYVNATGENKQRTIWYAGALIFFVLGLMSKPMLVTLPFVMVLLDFWPLCRISGGENFTGIRKDKLKSVLLEKWPFFALSVILCIVTYCAQKDAREGAGSFKLYYAANALISYLRYIGRMFWPFDLSIIYPFSPISYWEIIGVVAVLLAISLVCVRAAKRHPYLLMGWCWYLGTLVPVIGFLQVGPQSSADRYTYVPLTGLFVLCVWGIADLMKGWKWNQTAAGIAGAMILALCSADTMYQLQFWKNGVTLFGRTLAVTANNPYGQVEYAGALTAAGQKQEAFAHEAEAIRLAPGLAMMQNDYATALVGAGRVQEALQHYAEAARLAPKNALIQNNYGAALARAGQTNAAIARYEAAIQDKSTYSDAYNNLGAALAGEGRFDEAAGVLGQALAIDPNNADIHLNLGLDLLKLGRIPDAGQEFLKAVNLDPDEAQAQYELGLCLTMVRQSAAALSHLQAAAQLRPDWVDPLNALAWILATDGDDQVRNGAQAVGLAEHAATLTMWQDPVILNTLAAAYAEAGRFDDAINTATKAIALAQKSGQDRLAAQIQSLLSLYQQHRAFHHS